MLSVISICVLGALLVGVACGLFWLGNALWQALPENFRARSVLFFASFLLLLIAGALFAFVAYFVGLIAVAALHAIGVNIPLIHIPWMK